MVARTRSALQLGDPRGGLVFTGLELGNLLQQHRCCASKGKVSAPGSVSDFYARYAVDERWLVPHFEKMLYDNALLTVVDDGPSMTHAQPLGMGDKG